MHGILVFLCLQLLKGPESVILSHPPWKDDNARFTTVPFKALPDQEWVKCQFLTLLQLISLNYGFSTKVTCAFLLQKDTLSELIFLNLEIGQYFPNFWSDKGFKGTGVSRVLIFLNPSFPSYTVSFSFLKQKERSVFIFPTFIPKPKLCRRRRR